MGWKVAEMREILEKLLRSETSVSEAERLLPRNIVEENENTAQLDFRRVF